MIKVVSFKICPFVQRMTALLEAKGMDYEVEYIDLSDKPQWFLEISPNGQVPVLITDSGQTLFESDAIAEYLDDIAPPLQPNLTPEDKALNRAWSYQASKHYLVQCSAMSSPDSAALVERQARLGKAFARAEQVLGDGPYFSGAQLGNVDIAWLPLLHRADIIKNRSGHDFLSAYPKVSQWQAALLQTGLADASVAEDFETRFARFYLSEKTYLGRGHDRPETCTPAVRAGGGCCG